MNLALLCTLLWFVIVVVLMIYADRDQRRDPVVHRFVIGFRSNALARRSRRWRWTLHPAPRDVDVLDIVAERDLLDVHRTHGWARTYLGATFAARRARWTLEGALEQHRRELEEYLATFDARERS